MRIATIVLLAAVTLLTTACVRVRPWEREILARKDMAWSPDEMESASRSHIFFAKEAALGGGGSGGGGCGCN
ncbi:MAG: DUF4266 domain-containing protein [Myxococcota bacterium]|nr:DUF4266 domain-containing protein [Myxococcota bacterium]